MDPTFSKYLEKELEDARRGRIDLSISDSFPIDIYLWPLPIPLVVAVATS
jgi:hypothetical protein